MGDRDDAIEAGAKAMFESGMPKAVTPWERRSDDYKRAFLDEAALIYDAMAPHIRRAGRKAIADQIEDDCDHNPNRVCDVCDHAAKLVRRIAVTR